MAHFYLYLDSYTVFGNYSVEQYYDANDAADDGADLKQFADDDFVNAVMTGGSVSDDVMERLFADTDALSNEVGLLFIILITFLFL